VVIDAEAADLVARARDGDGAAWAEVVDRVRSGDRAVWEALVDRYTSLVWSVARSFRLGDADAGDVHQTVWLRLVEHIDRVLEPARLPGWLSSTARNECLRLLRRRGRELVDDEPEADLGAPEPGPEELVLTDERDAGLWRAFAALSARCRQLLRLLVLDPELPYADVAETLGVPVGSLGPTRSRCLDRLRSSAEVSRIRSAGA
jgi:RNA polymerase sigma factor (sigma-70 family)